MISPTTIATISNAIGIALLDTASSLMREGDTVDVSLSELSKRSGLNSALVKYYFGNKAGLLKALVEQGVDVIFGYPGANEINLAMENGEVGGRGSNSWSSWKATKPTWLTQKLSSRSGYD